MVEGLDLDDAVTGTGEQKSSGSGQRSRRPSVGEPHEGAVEILMSLLEDPDANGEIEMYAFAEDAREDDRFIPDSLKEQLDLPEEMETFSWEDLFGLDLEDYEYVGYPPRDRSGDGVTYEEGWDSSNFTGDLTGETKKAINGHYPQEIQERLGPEDATADEPAVMLAIRKGKDSKHGDFESAARHQRFYIQDTEKSGKRVLQARRDVEEISESEYQDLLEQNGWAEDDDD